MTFRILREKDLQYQYEKGDTTSDPTDIKSIKGLKWTTISTKKLNVCIPEETQIRESWQEIKIWISLLFKYWLYDDNNKLLTKKALGSDSVSSELSQILKKAKIPNFKKYF